MLCGHAPDNFLEILTFSRVYGPLGDAAGCRIPEFGKFALLVSETIKGSQNLVLCPKYGKAIQVRDNLMNL